MNDLILTRQKIKFFSDKKLKVHIDTTSDKFYNGIIKEVSEEFIILTDRFIGDVPIFLLEIKKIEEFK